jgi:tetratricopeptide (TPR) repeat protein/nitrate reductase NapE component
MSLLMDALKRAEKARQAEASSDGAELDLASTQGFSLDPIDESASAERSPPREPTLDQPVSPTDTGGDLSLENTQAVRGRLGVEDDDAGSASIDDTGGRSLDDSISLVDDEDAIDPPHRIPQDTSATLPSLKQARQSVDNYFDGTGSASLTRDDLNAAMANEATAPHQRVAGDTDTQRRVRAVFHAKEASRGRRGRNWVAMGLVPLLLLAIVGGVVFVYWDALSGMIFGKPTLVQAPRTVPQPVAPAPQSTPPPSTGTAAPVVVAGTTPTTAPSAPDTGTSAASTGATAPSAPTAPAAKSPTPVTPPAPSAETKQPTMTELAASAPSAAQVTGPTQQASGRRLSAEEQVAQAIQRAGLAPASPTGGMAFKIKHRSVPDKLHPRLERAYEAWRSGNLVEAKRDYERVLRSDPRNRNAMLGLGAIAVREGRWDDASERYTALLRLNPKDSIAQAGLIAVHENVDPLRGESQIKLLLREEPDAPHLHFTLGNMYAAQRRWGEAQAAYFDAYRLESENPDYAYNLAVSLDQLGKSDLAADYYRRALALAAEQGAVFDQPSVRDRLLRLAFEGTAQ